MAQHGYLHDTYDKGDFGGGDERERGWSDRDRDWRGRDSDWRERDRSGGAMFGGRHDEDRGNFRSHDEDRGGGRGDDRGFFGRMGEQASSWFRDDEHEYRRGRDDDRFGGGRERGMSHYGREHGYGGFQGDFGRSGRDQGGFGGRGDYSQGRQRFSAHPDDHYRSWRDRQVEALDRDYQDYCREREQQFHQDFDSWRRTRQQQNMSGQQQTGQQGGTSDEALQLDNSGVQTGETQQTTSPMGAATMGTNNSENTGAPTTGRGRR